MAAVNHLDNSNLGINQLIHLDTFRLCKSVQKKDTLQKIMETGSNLKSEIFFCVVNSLHKCNGIHIAMRNNWVDMVDQYSRQCMITFAQKIYLAICGTHLNYFKHLVADHEDALRTGHYSTDYDNGDFFNSRLRKISYDRMYSHFFDYAALNGEYQVLESDLDKSVLGTHLAMLGAITHGHYDVVKWLHRTERMLLADGNRATGCIPGSIYAATENKREKILNYLLDDCRNQKREIKDALSLAESLKYDGIVNILTSKMAKSVSSRKKGRIYLYFVLPINKRVYKVPM
jgi:uncharacterized protein YjgD (DUF1641 family)